jgi:hypothetical protein
MALVRLAAVLLIAASSAGANGVTRIFPDSTGDSSGAPDITKVRVTAGASSVTFAVQATTASSWQDAAAILSIDTDADPATGDAGGSKGFELSYVLHSNHDEFTLDQSNGIHIRNPTATWTLSGPTLTIVVPFAELRAEDSVRFRVEALAAAGSDSAPDGPNAAWQFTPTAVPTALAATFLPGTPQHGKPFAVRRVAAAFSDGTQGVATPTCVARLGVIQLRRSGCRWLLPANARGRPLTITLAAAGLKRTYRLRVR